MGLDMYLNKMPRHKDATVHDVDILESYFNWKNKKKDPNSRAKNYTFKQWCGVEYKDVPNGDVRKFYEQFFTVKYSHWDVEKKYGHYSIMEQVGYWRKANAIHKWFVDNVQNEVDDCGDYEVSKEQLEELLEICTKVRDGSKLVKGLVQNGMRFENGQCIPCMEEGEYIENPEVAEELLPTQNGFFFGGTNYDQWYLEDIVYTIGILTKVLETTDFDREMITYHSSW